ncbi:unnamed protein product [Moneuplotes crassus]|uniref:RING-type domain-containing protein n=1 Tax=Euplotes crassus TaxID=5936 RepID=A0AAD1UG28_EUPCR|nr:unnamed protein product [Moneuplotes crassus]
MELPPQEEVQVSQRMFGLWFVNTRLKRFMNYSTAFIQAMILIAYWMIEPLSFLMTFIISMMLYGIRTWWIWWCDPTDTFFWISIRIRISSFLLFFSCVLAWTNILIVELTGAPLLSLFNVLVTYPVPVISLILNLVNVFRLMCLWLAYTRIHKAIRRRMEQEDQVFNNVFAVREGYRETRQELEAAGISPQELDEIQRIEIRNVRRALGQFGQRALENINMVRTMLNIDGDRDPDDTEENRIILFTKITSLPFNKEKHGEYETCTICCGEFEEEKYIKVLPKCSHIFHEECIEGWILKAKHQMICCPICRTNIKEEIDLQYQEEGIQDNSLQAQEDSKRSEDEEALPVVQEENLLDLTDNNSQNSA